jgi:DNA-binding NarL/FixJ family response regulator
LLEQGGYDVVAEASDAAAALPAHRKAHPDIVLLDIQLPDRDGFDLARILLAESNPPRVVLISSRDLDAYRQRLALLPACSFLAKDALSLAAFEQAVGSC